MMKTEHEIYFQDAKDMSFLPDDSVGLMITSPPYPMIEMWDEIFTEQNPEIGEALEEKNGRKAFELMHQILDEVWDEVYRVLKPGGAACINIGDATRTINGDFQLYNSHSRILNHCLSIGFQSLPSVIWRKQTNAPNKFMGSGMVPPGAYVTLEHEYVLVLRKGGKREFKTHREKENRRESAFFWEERNKWFSDVWSDLKGTRQRLNHKELRERSAAYPFELAYRLINMFSVKRDIVLDPFLGIATTTVAALASERNSVGIEIDPNFKQGIKNHVEKAQKPVNKYIKERLENHLSFVERRKKKNKDLKYVNENYNFPVVTRQEKKLFFRRVDGIEEVSPNRFKVSYSDGKSSQFEIKTDKLTSYLEQSS